MSLSLEENNLNPYYWESEENMRRSLLEARVNWINLFGAHTLPVNYVAPHNVITTEGIKQLVQVLPSIHIISTSRGGIDGETQMEFGALPEFPGLYSIPRNASGYHLVASQKIGIVSGILGPGIWSHFIHGDDIFDPNRSLNLSWEEMKNEFQIMIDFVRVNFPWLEYSNTRDAHKKLLTYDENDLEIILKGDKVNLNGSPGLRLRIRLNEHALVGSHGINVLYTYPDGKDLVIELQEFNSILFIQK